MEERGSERNLTRERFERLLNSSFPAVEHVLERGPNNFQHQHVVFSVYPFYLEMIQEREDTIGSRMCRRSGREVTMNPDLAVPGSTSHDELEGDVSTTLWRDC